MITETREAYEARIKNAKSIDGHTGLLALIGSPIGHSGSPAMYNYCFDKLGLNYAYLCLETQQEDTGRAIEALRMFGVRGFNVTMPCKTEAVKYVDELSRCAKLIGATNTVVNENGKLVGHNTDGFGWVRACREHGIEVEGARLTICGSGGAATSIEVSSALSGVAEIDIFARKDSFYENAERTVEKIHANVPGCTVTLHDLSDEDAFHASIDASDIFANATKVGMKPMDGESIVKDLSVFRPGLAVTDVVYNPRETKMLRDAREAGCTVMPGMAMLLWQGAEAFHLYTGCDMPVDEVEKFL